MLDPSQQPAPQSSFAVSLPLISPAPVAFLAGAQSCPNCGRSWGAGRTCQYCRQIEGVPVGVTLSPVGKRIGALLLDVALSMVTFGIGWFIWALIVFGRGQTPAKQLMGMRYLIQETGRPAGWGRTFVREVFAKGVIGTLATLTVVGILFYFWLVWDRDNQELWDKLVGTVVVDDSGQRWN